MSKNTIPTIPSNAPLAPEQIDWLNNFLPSLQTDQLTWLEGFVSGLRAGRGAAPAGAQTSAPAAKPQLTVLYGTESGNAENLADQTVKVAAKEGFKAKAVNMSDLSVAKLKDVENLLVIVSTWGEGDPPETAVDFYTTFMADGAPRLEQTKFSVLGLGDTSYEHFCKMGKDFDSRLEALGAKRIYKRVDCDVDFDDDFAAWQKGALEALKAEVKTVAEVRHAAPAAAAPAVKYSRKNPFQAELKERVVLNGEGSAKETIHLEFDLEGSGLSYETGDALAVIPSNDGDLVDGIIKAAGLDPAAKVTLKDGEFALQEALTTQLDVTALSKPVLTRYNAAANSSELEAILAEKEKLNDYIYGRDLVDLIQDFPIDGLTADALVGMLRKLPPRLYSIASSPKAHDEEVHLTVGVVRYESRGRGRKGVCSTHLAERVQTGEKVGVFVTPNKNFRLPTDTSKPVIMVGPGTGIAPFRAFIEERKATEATGKNWLFFGDQHYLTDFLYQTELQDYLADGVLTKLDVAFSRDQKQKVYVQDRMRANAKEIFAWLEEGGSFYVCGDASRMASDVDKALHDIIASEGKLDEAGAVDYVKALKADKRYQRDVY